MKKIFDQVSRKTSKLVTTAYSTSFSLGIRFLSKEMQNPIYAIYGFVRFADEIVDTFHDFDKKSLLQQFKIDTYKSIEQKISLNPILHNFQETVHRFQIPLDLIDTFLASMEMDLNPQEFNQQTYEKYILGSAEVVGLMCLKVFVKGDEEQYEILKPYAMKLGSAFQKINFLRDYKEDNEELGRIYFPQLQLSHIDEKTKKDIEADIAADFAMGYIGIKKLPKEARLGVYVAYIYYSSLLRKIMEMPPQRILQERVRVPNNEKFTLFFGSYLKHSFNLL